MRLSEPTACGTDFEPSQAVIDCSLPIVELEFEVQASLWMLVVVAVVTVR